MHFSTLSMLKIVTLVIFIFLFDTLSALGQINTSGFLRNYNAILTSSDYEHIIGRNRLRLNADKRFDNLNLYSSFDFINTYTESNEDVTFNLRELYFDLYFNKTDVRIGKQIINLGKSNSTFITDILTPLDLSEFLTQDFSDIKSGLTSVKVTQYLDNGFLELVATPIFQSNNIGSPESRWFPNTGLESNLNLSFENDEINFNQNSFQASLRWAIRKELNWEIDLLAMYWTPGNPAFTKDFALSGILNPQIQLNLNDVYLKTPILGYSASYSPINNLLIRSESAFYFERYVDYLPVEVQALNFENLGLAEILANLDILNPILNEAEDGFLQNKPFLNSLVGFESTISGVNFSSEWAMEYIFKHDAEILQDQLFYYTSLRAQRFFLRDKLSTSIFGRYNFNGKDFWINPEVSYTFFDGFESSAGFQFFGGESREPLYVQFSFEDYKSNSFGYLKLVAYF